MRELEIRDPTPVRLLDLVELARLPVRARVVDRLSELLILADELRSEFQTEEANPMLWLEPQIERIHERIDALVRRFAQ